MGSGVVDEVVFIELRRTIGVVICYCIGRIVWGSVIHGHKMSRCSV